MHLNKKNMYFTVRRMQNLTESLPGLVHLTEVINGLLIFLPPHSLLRKTSRGTCSVRIRLRLICYKYEMLEKFWQHVALISEHHSEHKASFHYMKHWKVCVPNLISGYSAIKGSAGLAHQLLIVLRSRQIMTPWKHSFRKPLKKFGSFFRGTDV